MLTLKRVLCVLIALSSFVAACAAPSTPGPSASAAASPTTPGSAVPSIGPVADLILTNANVLTMDDAQPRAEAVAITGDRITAVGSLTDVGRLAGPDTQVIDVEGQTIVPGFIDAHQHRIGDGPSRLGYNSPGPILDAAIAQGLTTINELYVDQARLKQLRDLDSAGLLRLRVNAYLPVQENSAEGRLFGDWFDVYTPGQAIGPHVRVAGLKVFTDYANATILLWKQADLDAFLLRQHRKGWQLAVKTVSTRSLEMIIHAFRAIQAADPNVVAARGRLEHMLFATADQITAIGELGLVPIVNLNVPGELVGAQEIDELISREPRGSYAPWRSVFEAGIPAAGMTGFPSAYVDEPSGAPFGSPVHLIYQAVTRVGNLGQRSPASLLDQAMTAEQALRALTINAARASFEEGAKGSLVPGKLADLVLLSADPLAVSAEEINNIEVLMTLVGGKIEHCAAVAPCGSAGARTLWPSLAIIGSARTRRGAPRSAGGSRDRRPPRARLRGMARRTKPSSVLPAGR